MNIHQNVSLADHSTMRLGGTARYLAEITSRQDLLDVIAWADAQKLPIITIGEGSNIVWQDSGFDGLIIVNKTLRYEVFNEDAENSYITIGAGEDWDSVVERTVVAGLTGIEALSMIPGTAGATPIQNVGAYGQQMSDVLTAIEVYDIQEHNFAVLNPADCNFGYRTSRFKTTDKGRFIITAITIHLSRRRPTPPFYEALQDYLNTNHISEYTPQNIRNAVMNIRAKKLPDPSLVANNGSFFANPIIDQAQATDLQAKFPDLPMWPAKSGTFKLPAAWLIEYLGFKNFHDEATGMATWQNHALVLVNEHAKTTADLLAFKQKIVSAVQDTFGVTLEQEPELLPLTTS